MASPRRATPDLAAWSRAAALVHWREPYREVFRDGPWRGEWFPGGRLDLVDNLVGRHARTHPDAPALLWEGEQGDSRVISYGVLSADVAALARALRTLRVGRGDRVALHLGAIPEAVVAMLACAHVGATYVVVPVPLPADGLIERLAVLAPKVLITQDGAWRRGMVLPLKARADDALSALAGVEHTIVVRRTGMDVAWFEGDRWYHDLVAGARPGPGARDDAEPAELLGVADPLTLAALPQRGGLPATAALGPGSVLAAAALHRGAMSEGGVLWVAGDMSWPGMQFHGVLGPLALGATLVLAEGTLDVPTPLRAWELMAKHEVSTFVTVPSVLRRMRSWVRDLPDIPVAPALRRVVSVGEALDAELRGWVERDLAGVPLTTADGWGQIELGGVVSVDRPLRPEYLPEAGMQIVHEDGPPATPREARGGGGAAAESGEAAAESGGAAAESGEAAAESGEAAAESGGAAAESGELVLSRMWAGMMLPSGGDSALLRKHWPEPDGPYFSGDRARRTAAGDWEFLGRIDQIVSVLGQLVSLGEVRALLAEHPFAAAVDVIERGDLDGSCYIAAAVVPTDAAPQGDLTALARELTQSVREILGGLACPKLIMVVDRFGDELRGDERRRTLRKVHVPPGETTVAVSWPQILAMAQAPD